MFKILNFYRKLFVLYLFFFHCACWLLSFRGLGCLKVVPMPPLVRHHRSLRSDRSLRMTNEPLATKYSLNRTTGATSLTSSLAQTSAMWACQAWNRQASDRRIRQEPTGRGEETSAAGGGWNLSRTSACQWRTWLSGRAKDVWVFDCWAHGILEQSPFTGPTYVWIVKQINLGVKQINLFRLKSILLCWEMAKLQILGSSPYCYVEKWQSYKF